jgi:hypothetical protein
MEAYVKVKTLICIGVIGFAAPAALAQAPPATTSTVSADSLLAAGYEVKAIHALSDASVKEIWPGQTLPTQIMITLQKGNSVAVCEMATVSWANLINAPMSNNTLCSKR